MSRNLLAEMKRQLLSPSKVKGTGRVIKDSSWFRIPAVGKYIVKVQPYNPLLEQIGIRLRLPMKFEAKTNSSEKANRYMKGIIYRIRKKVLSGEYEAAGKLVELNMKYSRSFRMSAFNKVLSGGYYNLNYKEVGKSLRIVDKLIYKEKSNLDYKRVYIEKANGKLRPLGVPSREGRVVLHMGNNFMVEIQRSQLSNSQHGYVPNKGTMTAGKSVLAKVHKNMVYETDLKGFFDNVSIGKVVGIIRGQSEKVTNGIIGLSKSKPKIKKAKMDESKFNFQETKGEFMSWKNRSLLSKIFNFDDKMNISSDIIRVKVGNTTGKRKVYYNDIMDRNSRMFMDSGEYKLKSQNFGLVPGGFPQGMPLSPFLSILALRDYLSQAENVNYADDQIFFSDSELKIMDYKNQGIIHSPEKCKGIKKDGKGIVDSFKFLGFRLYQNYEGKSETRKGVKEPVNPKISKLYSNEGLAKLKLIKSKDSLMQLSKGLDVTKPLNINQMESLKNITQRRFFGFVISCMTIGDWENNHSWSDRRKAERTMNEKLNVNSLLGRTPNILDSSKCIPHLGGIITKIIKKHSSKKCK